MIGKIKSLLLKNQTAGQTAIKNTFWLFSGELIGRLIRSGIVIYAARLLGAAGYGAFSYAMATAGLITILSDVGISSVLTREAVKFPELRRQYFSTALAVKAVLITVNLFVVIFILPHLITVPAAKTLLPLIAFILAFDTLRDFGFSMLRALEKMEIEALIKILMNIAMAGLGLFFIMRVPTAHSLALGYAIGTGIGFLLMLIILWPYFKGWSAHFNKGFVKKIIITAWPIGLLGVLGAITINTDMIMIGWLGSPEELGFYAAAQKPVQLLYVIPILLASAVFPLFAKLAIESKERLRYVLERSVSISLLIAIPIVLGGLILAKDIVLLLYGTEYTAATTSFQLLLITLLINAAAYILNNAILAYDKQLYFLRFFAIGAIANIVFNFLLIPRFGIEGAAVATIFAQLLGNAFIWKTIHGINPFSIFPYLTRITLAAIIMASATLLLQWLGFSFILNLAVSALFYFVLLALMKEPLLKEGRRILQRPQI